MEEILNCDLTHVHDELVNKAKKEMPKDEVLYDLAELFKVFGDSTRVKILWALFESEMCVCDISELLNMSLSAVSHQLRILKQARLVKFRKEGKNVFYSLDDDHVSSIFNIGLLHISENYKSRD